MVATLRLAPDVISVAEMRDTEAYAAQEASLTGHTVVITLHAGSPRQAQQQSPACAGNFHTTLRRCMRGRTLKHTLRAQRPQARGY